MKLVRYTPVLLCLLSAVGGCQRYGRLDPGPRTRVIEPVRSMCPLVRSHPNLFVIVDPKKPPAGPPPIAKLTTGLAPAFGSWVDDLKIDRLSVDVHMRNRQGKSVLPADGILFLTLFSDDIDKLDRRGKPLVQWKVPGDQWETLGKDSSIMGRYLAMTLSIKGHDLPPGYYTLETRLELDGVTFIHIDPGLELIEQE